MYLEQLIKKMKRNVIFCGNSQIDIKKIKNILKINVDTIFINIYANEKTIHLQNCINHMLNHKHTCIYYFISSAYEQIKEILEKHGFQENVHFANADNIFLFYDNLYCLNHGIVDNNIAIYVVTHKEIKYTNIDFEKMHCYKMILAGASLKNDDYGYLRDDKVNDVVVNNISNLNYDINELTALYWIWKYADEEYTGLNHYRRYWIRENCSITKENIINKNDIIHYLSQCDIIVSTPPILLNNFTIKDLLKNKANNDLFDNIYNIFIEVINEKQPEYINCFHEMMAGNVLIPCNMFMAKKSIFNKYCEWIFSFIIDVVDKIDLSNYTGYNRRIIGMFGEYMLTIWLMKNNYTVKCLNNIVLSDDEFFNGMPNMITDPHRF